VQDLSTLLNAPKAAASMALLQTTDCLARLSEQLAVDPRLSGLVALRELLLSSTLVRLCVVTYDESDDDEDNMVDYYLKLSHDRRTDMYLPLADDEPEVALSIKEVLTDEPTLRTLLLCFPGLGEDGPPPVLGQFTDYRFDPISFQEWISDFPKRTAKILSEAVRKADAKWLERYCQ
jgi:hypothetical protein